MACSNGCCCCLQKNTRLGPFVTSSAGSSWWKAMQAWLSPTGTAVVLRGCSWLVLLLHSELMSHTDTYSSSSQQSTAASRFQHQEPCDQRPQCETHKSRSVTPAQSLEVLDRFLVCLLWLLRVLDMQPMD